jgi:hypothetical protein
MFDSIDSFEVAWVRITDARRRALIGGSQPPEPESFK